VLCGFVFSTSGFLLLTASTTRAADIPGGIEGKIVTVDVDKGAVTIALANGRERTFAITQETLIVGPRGGTVRRRLKDHRFHEGLSITVVAEGNTADELHLGYDRKARQGSGKVTSPSSGSSSSSRSNSETEETQGTGSSTSTTRTSRFRGNRQPAPAAGKDSREEEGDDEDDDFVGKVKSVEPARHLLVITLLNGKNRAFLLSRDVKVMVNGRTSPDGLSDTAIKPGIPLTVVTETGSRKVKEVKVTPALTRRHRRAS
jgi:hypothetical protein